RRRHTRFSRDWSSDVCSSDLSHTPNAGGLGYTCVNLASLAKRSGGPHAAHTSLYHLPERSRSVSAVPTLSMSWPAWRGNWYTCQVGRGACRGGRERPGVWWGT